MGDFYLWMHNISECMNITTTLVVSLISSLYTLWMLSTVITISHMFYYTRFLLHEIQHVQAGRISPHMPRISTLVTSSIKRLLASYQRCGSLAILNQIPRWSSKVINFRRGHSGLNYPGCSVGLPKHLG